MKILIIRFSSIGDLTQALSLPAFIKLHEPDAIIHLVTRLDLAELAQNNPAIERIWSLDKKSGFKGLIQLVGELRLQNFTHVYDAHNNLRSFILRTFLRRPKKLVRPMMRLKRFLLLRWHINLFQKPFSGQRDLIQPLETWGMNYSLPPTPQVFLNSEIRAEAQKILDDNKIGDFYVLVPSAAYELKRWPLDHWKKLIELNPKKIFLVLAGPTDHFTTALNSYSNVVNLYGKTRLMLSAALIEKAIAVVSNDTGLLHIAEQLGKPSVALMGPAPFGFPSRPSTVILERDLNCRPCSKHGQGPCINPHYQECLDSISPAEVSLRLGEMQP